VKKEPKRTYRIAELAKLCGLSVRALHHYDAIGLLVPTKRSASGYRLYDESAVLRLQQILIGRELGLALEEIRRSLDDPRFDPASALKDQRVKLEARVQQTRRMIESIDHALALLDRKDTDMKALFEGFDPSAHEEEARARWGETEAYRVSAARTKGYGPKDWSALREEQAAIYRDALAAKNAGAPPTDPRAMDVAEKHRASIDRWFYPCSHAMHRGLADMYEADPRFTQSIDAHGEGLAAYLAAAIRANAERAASTVSPP
jgi:MerR family transcriptional regulator, thiopeptide resistance regulator